MMKKYLNLPFPDNKKMKNVILFNLIFKAFYKLIIN